MKPSNPFSQPTPENVKTVSGFLYWVWEREAMRIARENGYSPPWTKDEVLQKYRFCNIRRKDDRVSQWLITHVYAPRALERDLWFYAAICRYVNWPPAIQKLLEAGVFEGSAEEFDPRKFADVIDGITVSGGKAWTGAYMTYPGHAEPGSPKGWRTAKYILEPLKEIAEEVRMAVYDVSSVEDVVLTMEKSYGWSTFMAGQVAADLTYFREHLGSAGDLYTWAPLGPGSQSGLNYLHGHKQGASWQQGQFNNALEVLNKIVKSDTLITDLTLHDVQNCCCEYSKYIKAVSGEGRPRNTYKPETAY